MITVADVSEKLREVPFQPFRIVTSSGSTYDIPHPDLVFVTKRILYVGVFNRGNSQFPDHAASVSVLHISELQPLALAAA